MKTVAKIVAQRGGLDALDQQSIRIENKPYMPLVIELAWNGPLRGPRVGPRGSVLVSVAHIFVQEGDVVYDPEMEFEVSPDLATWQPISWRQGDSIREAVWITAHQVQIDRRALRELEQFARMWDRRWSDIGALHALRATHYGRSIVRAQGFLAAAKGGDVSR